MAACLLCAHADRHGSWPRSHRGTHCRRCHRSWVSLAQAHCVVCHEQFASNGVADLHWVKGIHTHPSEVRRLEARSEAYGTVWRTAQKATIAPVSRDLSPATAPTGVSA